MNPFDILKIDPTTDKMAIRRAYVREIKRHHPDSGGDPIRMQAIQSAYENLINAKSRKIHGKEPVIECEAHLSLNDMLQGCEVSVLADINGVANIIQATIPPRSYPGSVVEFFDYESTGSRIRVKIVEIFDKEFTRLESNIVVKRKINTREANAGIDLNINNFDGNMHTVRVSPETTADRLIYNIPSAGFFEKETKARGCLTIIVEIQKEGN